MYQKCRLNDFKVKRENIRLLLQVIDPHAVDIRLRRRLKRRNYGLKDPIKYDKLKNMDPYTYVHVYLLDEVTRVWNAHYVQSTKEENIQRYSSNVYIFPELFQVQY